MREPGVAPVFSAARIAEILREPGERLIVPTDEQTAVIEQPLQGSVLVVAGAGSGKTETMANRVIWLVSNGLALPGEILGLTFTRKAAGELGVRVAGRLIRFAERVADLAERGGLSEAEQGRAVELAEVMADGLDLPETGTYDAFAASLVQEFGALAGVSEPPALIDDATAWRLARETVRASRDPQLVETDASLTTLVGQVIDLDQAVHAHRTDFDSVERLAERFCGVARLPRSEKELASGKSGAPYADLAKHVQDVTRTRLIARLAAEYAAEKRRRGLASFSDILALALDVVEHSEDAVRAVRRRTRAVLLDEVQDTSFTQMRLLSRLFAGTAVMAVGDPHQSIYGWRGASADSLQRFPRDFRAAAPAPARAAAPAAAASERVLTLSRSWRNPTRVLDAANVVAAPLIGAAATAAEAARRAGETGIEVPELRPREGAPPGAVETLFAETLADEFAGLAEWLGERLEEFRAEQRRRAAADPQHRVREPTAAVLFRSRKHMAAVSSALGEAGIPNRIVGVGGLLGTPEVTEVVSALHCLWFADANGHAIRLLTGPRFAIGVADIAGLRRAARWFSERDSSHRPLSADDLAREGALPDADRAFSLLDALDEIVDMRTLEHGALSGISPIGRERMREAGRMLRQLRFSLGGGVPELLRAVEHALRLDIELEANERAPHDGGAAARANLDAFADVVEGFLALDEHGTLAALLDWLERAAHDDTESAHSEEPEPGTVQLITVHGAKGLEWDIVAIPRLVKDEFPAPSRAGAGWLAAGRIPDPLRGDAAALPTLDWQTDATQKEVRESIAAYKQALRDRHADEERRLAYVALTRSAGSLLLTGSFWGGQKSARPPSEFVIELHEAGLLAELPAESAFDDDPSEHAASEVTWPLDPLGARAEPVLAAAALVRRAAAGAHGGRAAGPEATEHDELPADAAVAETRAEALERSSRAPGRAPGAERPVHPGIDDRAGLLIEERRAALPPSADEAGGRSSNDSRGRTGLPSRITASTFHEFVEDPEEAERRRLRPLPIRPYRRTRLGNQFHEWVERRSTTAAGSALALPGLEPEPADSPLEPFEQDVDLELAELVERFERSRWALLQPIAVEQEVTLPFAGRRVVCKFDAVYRYETDDGSRYEVVDWKTGRAPRTDEERELRFLQLDLYRHAYAQWAGVEPERIDVTLYYVSEDEELRGGTARSLDELEALWLAAASSLPAGPPAVPGPPADSGPPAVSDPAAASDPGAPAAP